MNFRAAIGRFVRDCIAASVMEEANVRHVPDHRFNPDFMTIEEINDYHHGDAVNWDLVALRARTGARMFPHMGRAPAGIPAYPVSEARS